MNATILWNPRAGRLKGSLEPALDILDRAGWTLSVRNTQGPGDATELARQAARSGADAVLVAGGDGTVNEAVQALAGTDTALGYLPLGTVNVWARELNMPLSVQGAARSLVDGRIERVDLGVANDRYFLLMASLGFDGEVLRRARTLEHHKQRFGVLPYVAIGLSTVALYRGYDVELRYDGLIRRVQALMLVIGNTRLYGTRFKFTPNAVANDGWLDLCIVKGQGPLALMRQSLPVLLSGSVKHSDVELFRVRELSIGSDEPVQLQVDGELIGTSPVNVHLARASLQVIIPREFTSSLIA